MPTLPTKKVKFFDPGKAFQNLMYETKGELLKEMVRVLNNGDLILRNDVEKFERKLAKFVGIKYAVGLNSGTDALYLALKACGVGRHDEVLVPSHTFVATVQVVVQCGAIPILYDMDGNFDINIVTKRTKAIIPCHIAGEVAWEASEMPFLMKVAADYNLFVIEDACQALGATQWGGQKAGSFGLAGCFSFYPAKILGAFGDAGALVTNSERVYNYVKEARNHFKTDYRDWGINSRMDNLQAAVLNVKIQYLDQTLQRRAEIASQYNKSLYNVAWLSLPSNTPGRVWQDYIIRVLDTERVGTSPRDKLYDFLKSKGVETMKNEYPFPIRKLPKSVEYEASTLRLPCNENLTDDEIDYVITCLRDFTL